MGRRAQKKSSDKKKKRSRSNTKGTKGEGLTFLGGFTVFRALPGFSGEKRLGPVGGHLSFAKSRSI
jgi:hypothetical protein